MRKRTLVISFATGVVSFWAALVMVVAGVMGPVLATALMVAVNFIVSYFLARWERRRFEIELQQINSFLRHSEGERTKILLGLPDYPKEVE